MDTKNGIAPVDVYRILKVASDNGCLDVDHISALSRVIAALSNKVPVNQENYKCGSNYEAGLWSRRNIEAFFEDQDEQ